MPKLRTYLGRKVWESGYGKESLGCSNADINVVVKYRSVLWTPLFVAASFGHDAIAQLLLDYKVDPDPKDQDGRTPLSYAAENGHFAVVRVLLTMPNVDPNSRHAFRGRRTPLSYAAENGHLAVVTRLLERGAVPDARDQWKRTPLSYVVERRYGPAHMV